jgi:hypothetical protein
MWALYNRKLALNEERNFDTPKQQDSSIQEGDRDARVG